jgi:hypothetical protein
MKAYSIGVILISFFLISVFISSISSVEAKPEWSLALGNKVLTGVRIINVDNIDLVNSKYNLDFYLWFIWNPNDFTAKEIDNFEFLNGSPSKYCVLNDTTGQLEYRIRGEFIRTFDFSQYPLETHKLDVVLEHFCLDTTRLVYQLDSDSKIDEKVNIVGWNLKSFSTQITEHSFNNNTMSNFGFDLSVERPVLSSFAKNILPLLILTLIALLSFLIAPSNYETRVGLAISSLLSVSALHISLLAGIPSTGYMTLMDGITLIVYVMFFYILAVSVWIMKLVDQRRIDDAVIFNAKSWKLLFVLTFFMAMTLFIIY